MGARDDCSDREKAVILGKEATPENVQSLKKMVEQKAPLAAPLLDNAEYARYFTRRTYRGAIVKVNRINEGEWVCLIGDSAHSVLPPVGEGINSGLEDTMVFWECLRSNPTETLFAEFNRKRLPDLHAIGDYAVYLNEIPTFPGEAAARGIFMVANGLFTSETISNLLFGPAGLRREPYRDVVAKWRTQKLFILNTARLFVFPFAFVFAILASPITLYKLVSKAPSGQHDQSIKPPVGDEA